jgi:hypothetical protein
MATDMDHSTLAVAWTNARLTVAIVRDMTNLKQKAASGSTRVAPDAATSKEEDLPLWQN